MRAGSRVTSYIHGSVEIILTRAAMDGLYECDVRGESFTVQSVGNRRSSICQGKVVVSLTGERLLSSRMLASALVRWSVEARAKIQRWERQERGSKQSACPEA